MNEHTDQGAPVPKRGEAAWKEAMERTARRNDQARKAGKERREAYEDQRARMRREAEQRRRADLLDRPPTP